MKIPRGMNEEQVLNVVEEIATKLSPKLSFGHYTDEDIQQEGRMEAITVGLENFDDSKFTDEEMPKALERFLRVHVNNRLKNFKRNNMGRLERPINPDRVAAWERRNEARRNLMRPTSIHDIGDTISCKEVDLIEMINHGYLMEKIDRELPVEFRNDFLRMLSGAKIPKPRQNKVRDAVEEILWGTKENGGYANETEANE